MAPLDIERRVSANCPNHLGLRRGHRQRRDAPYHRLWHSLRNCRWAVTVLDVRASDSRASVAEVSQHGPRSVVSVPPMAGQPWRVGGDGNQECTLRAAIASLCGAAGWKPKKGVPGSNFILDHCRPGGEAARVPEVFQ